MNNKATRAAAKTASRSTFRMKHGAVLYKGGKIIKQSTNQPGFSKFASRFRAVPLFASGHAEIRAILNVDKKTTQGADVYVARLSAVGKLAHSKPCKMCENALRFVGIKRVFYSTDEQTWTCLYLGDRP